MTLAAATLTRRPALRVAVAIAEPAPWWERRSMVRRLVGGCPDHWWKPTAPATAACTCDRFAP